MIRALQIVKARVALEKENDFKQLDHDFEVEVFGHVFKFEFQRTDIGPYDCDVHVWYCINGEWKQRAMLYESKNLLIGSEGPFSGPRPMESVLVKNFTLHELKAKTIEVLKKIRAPLLFDNQAHARVALEEHLLSELPAQFTPNGTQKLLFKQLGGGDDARQWYYERGNLWSTIAVRKTKQVEVFLYEEDRKGVRTVEKFGETEHGKVRELTAEELKRVSGELLAKLLAAKKAKEHASVALAKNKNHNRQAEKQAEPTTRDVINVFDINKVKDISDHVKRYAELLLTLLQERSTSELEKAALPFGDKSVTPHFKTLNQQRSTKGIVYVRAIDPANKKFWRLYFGVTQKSVALLDAYDKDDNQIPTAEIERLAVRLTRQKSIENA
jgi:hypothetical protein